MRDANRLREDKEFEAASAKYKQIQQGSNEYEKALVYVAVCELSLDRVQEARATLERYLGPFLADPANATTSPIKLQKRREARGKGTRRGGSFPGTAEHPSQRKQVFAAALKRVSKEIGRMQKLEARVAHVETARRALAMRRAAQFPPRLPTGDTAGEGMRALPSQRRRTRVPPARIGSASQATSRP